MVISTIIEVGLDQLEEVIAVVLQKLVEERLLLGKKVSHAGTPKVLAMNLAPSGTAPFAPLRSLTFPEYVHSFLSPKCPSSRVESAKSHARFEQSFDASTIWLN